MQHSYQEGRVWPKNPLHTVKREIIEPMLLYFSYTLKFLSRDISEVSFYSLRPKYILNIA